MLRESKEEIGYKIKKSKLRYLDKLFIIQNEGIYNIHHVFFYEANTQMPIKLSDEHSEYKWMSKENILSFELIPHQKEVLSIFQILEKL